MVTGSFRLILGGVARGIAFAPSVIASRVWLRAGVGSAIFAIRDDKIFAANDALPGFWEPLRSLRPVERQRFFSMR
jgi:hypothetical protein